MKKILALVLVAVLCLPLIACAGEKDDRSFTYSITEPWGVRETTLFSDGSGKVKVEGDGSSFAKNKKAYNIAKWEIEDGTLVVKIYNDEESSLTATDRFDLKNLPEGLKGINE